MLSSGLPPLLLVLSVLELSWSLSDEEKKIIVDEHNKYRSHVSPPAMAMMKMTWDTDLEITAQNHAGDCNWTRNGGGKNLFATTSTLDVKLAIEEWKREREFYNFSTSECDPRRTCDDYLQVIWAETTHTGCESSPCKKVDGSKIENVQLLVCIYFPRGNMKGKKPYVEGPSCTTCPTGTVCVNNLCAALPKLTAKPEPTVPEATLTTATTIQNLTSNHSQATTHSPTAKHSQAQSPNTLTHHKSQTQTCQHTANNNPSQAKPTTTVAKPISAATTSTCATMAKTQLKTATTTQAEQKTRYC